MCVIQYFKTVAANVIKLSYSIVDIMLIMQQCENIFVYGVSLQKMNIYEEKWKIK